MDYRALKVSNIAFVGRLFICVVACSTIGVCVALRHSWNDWRPDSEIYLWMTLRDTGMSDKAALAVSQRFLAHEFSLNPDFRDVSAAPMLYTDRAPAWWREQFQLFINRPLYPLLSAVLYPHFGPFAMKAISAGSIVLASSALFCTLLFLTSPLRAAIGVAAFELQRVVLLSSAMAMTDALALCLWVIALGSIIAYQRRPTFSSLGAICVATVALTFARPAFYLPLGASVGVYLTMRRSHHFIAAIAPLFVTGIGAILYFWYSAVVHGPSLFSQLRWEYVYQHGYQTVSPGALGSWYIMTVLSGGVSMMMSALLDLGGLALVVGATLVAIDGFSSSGVVRTCITAAAFDLIALLSNPINPGRPVLLPLAPLIVILLVAGLERLSPSDDGRCGLPDMIGTSLPRSTSPDSTRVRIE